MLPRSPVALRLVAAAVLVLGALALTAVAAWQAVATASEDGTGKGELGPNLLRNASFELDANRDGRPDGWTVEWMWVKPPNRVELAAEAAEGERSLHVVVKEIGVPQGWGGRAFQDVLVQPGKAYRVSASIKMKGWQSLVAAEGVSVTVIWHFRDGSWSESQIPVTEELFAGDFDWKRFEGQVVAPDRADRVRVAVWANTGTGEIWFDDVRFQEVRAGAAAVAAAAAGAGAGAGAAPAGGGPGRRAGAGAVPSRSVTLKPRPAEARAVWVDDYTLATLKDRQDVARLFDRLEQAGVNMIMPFVWIGGYALWRSEVAPRNLAVETWGRAGDRGAGEPGSPGAAEPGDVSAGEDPLQVMVEEAHRRGMEIHPVVVVFMVGSKSDPGPIVAAHPDWVELDRNGQQVSTYDLIWVSPALPEVQDYLAGVFRELVSRYDIDGLQLDYIRYEISSPVPFGYNARELSLYRQATGVDARELAPGSEGEFAFARWRAEQVTRFVERVSTELRTLKPHLVLSAAVAADYRSALSQRYQDWKLWVEKGYLDLIFPMAYSDDLNEIREWVKTDLYLAGLGGGKALVYAGLAAYTARQPGELVEQIELCRELAAPGIALFATWHMDTGDYEALGAPAGPFRAEAVTPHGSPGEAAAANLRVLADTLKEAVAVDPAVKALADDLDRLAAKVEGLARSEGPLSTAPVEAIRQALAGVREELKATGRYGAVLSDESRQAIQVELLVADQLLCYWMAHPATGR